MADRLLAFITGANASPLDDVEPLPGLATLQRAHAASTAQQGVSAAPTHQAAGSQAVEAARSEGGAGAAEQQQGGVGDGEEPIDLATLRPEDVMQEQEVWVGEVCQSSMLPVLSCHCFSCAHTVAVGGRSQPWRSSNLCNAPSHSHSAMLLVIMVTLSARHSLRHDHMWVGAHRHLHKQTAARTPRPQILSLRSRNTAHLRSVLPGDCCGRRGQCGGSAASAGPLPRHAPGCEGAAGGAAGARDGTRAAAAGEQASFFCLFL